MPLLCERLFLPILAVGAFVSAAGQAQALDKFKVTGVDCEQFWQWRHTPVIHYDIVEERKADYETTPDAEYFRQAALRTAEYCDRTSVRPASIYTPARKITGVWFQSNDGQFKLLYDVEHGGLEGSVAVVNGIGERRATRVRAEAQQQADLEAIRMRDARAEALHQAELEAVRTREARARELKAAEEKATQDKLAAESAREQLFFDRRDLQLSRLGAEVSPASFTTVETIRTNPYHFRKLGLAIIRAQFNKMVSDKLAMFGNELAPVYLHIEDVDRFTRSGETVMLAFKVIDRGEVERSYGSLPDIIVSVMKAEPIFGAYVGASTCPGDDCQHIFDPPPPT